MNPFRNYRFNAGTMFNLCVNQFTMCTSCNTANNRPSFSIPHLNFNTSNKQHTYTLHTFTPQSSSVLIFSITNAHRIHTAVMICRSLISIRHTHQSEPNRQHSLYKIAYKVDRNFSCWSTLYNIGNLHIYSSLSCTLVSLCQSHSFVPLHFTQQELPYQSSYTEQEKQNSTDESSSSHRYLAPHL